MTEREYVLDRFGGCFESFKGRRIMLYGQGPYTEAIIGRFHKAYRFAAVLCDADASGEFCGVPVIHVDALADERPDMVILSEHKQTKEPDYERIHKVCEDCGILLWNMYGIDELAVHKELDSHVWQSFYGWERITRGYDVVSFAVPDTFMVWGGAQDDRPSVRPVFRRLARVLAQRQVSMVFVGRNVLPGSVIAQALIDGGIAGDMKQAESCLYMRRGEDLCMRTIRERFAGKRILHIGAGLVNDGIIPRFYGIDTYRMFFFTPSNILPDKAIAPKKKADASGEKIYREAMAAIDRNQIISFDVFDTLLLRKTLHPEDVFELTQKRALALGLQAQDFARRRKEAEQDTCGGKLADIYDAMRRHTGLAQRTLDRLMALELETERSVISRRDPVVQLYRYALEQGKRVVLTSDMYLPEEAIAGLLKANGITGWEKLFVSCEYGCFKSQGLFEQLKALRTAREGIVHIGDDPFADIWAAEDAGLEAVHIPSALELARRSGWSAAIERAQTLAERCLVGLSIAGAFEDPFQAQSMKDMPVPGRLIRYGHVAAAVITGYLTWLAEKLTECEYDGILFSARDGWLLNELYPKLAEAAKPSSLPAALYFYTSRHAAFLPVAAREEKQRSICDMVQDVGHRQFVHKVFGVEESELLPPAPGEERIAYVRRHAEQIERIAVRQKAAQLRYFKNCGLKAGGRYAMTDFISQGTTQSFLEQFAPFSLQGFYFGQPSYAADLSQQIDYYFHPQDSVLLRNYMEMEGAISSAEPSVEAFSDDGTPVFAKEVRTQEQIEQMRRVHDIIRRYVNEYFDLFYQRGDVIHSAVPDEIYAADGYHWVFEWLYDDWVQTELSSQ